MVTPLPQAGLLNAVGLPRAPGAPLLASRGRDQFRPVDRRGYRPARLTWPATRQAYLLGRSSALRAMTNQIAVHGWSEALLNRCGVVESKWIESPGPTE